MAQLNNLIVTGAGRFLNTIQGNISGNAATAGSATVASKIVITTTNPSSNTSYNIPFAASTGNQGLLGNDGLLFTSSQGTTSTLGTSAVILGNGTPKGTAGNKVGWLCLYGEWGGYAQLGYVSLPTSGVTTHYLPNTGGTLINSATYTDYTVTKTGSGASGSWGINITGSSASCTGNAASATEARLIDIYDIAPTAYTNYYIPFVLNDQLDMAQPLSANNGFRIRQVNGTTSAAGDVTLVLGNNTASGTAGNKVGKIWLYGNGAYRAALAFANGATANASHVFPTTGGTILNTGTTSYTQTLERGPKIGTIKINGTNTDLHAPNLINLTAQALQVNFLPMTTLTANTYIKETDGKATTYNGWSASDYIKVTANTTYAYIHRVAENQWNGCGSVYYAFYNSSKTFTHGGYTTTAQYSIVSTANDVYVRVSSADADINGANDSMFGLKSYLDHVVSK